MIPWWVLAIVVFGANFTLWGVIGLVRVLDASAERWNRRRSRNQVGKRAGRIAKSARKVVMANDVGRHRLGQQETRPMHLGVRDVAVLIAAHNEEKVIVDSLGAIGDLVPPANVHVVSDGSVDDTVELANRSGVHVISTGKNLGKAGALQEGIRRFRLVDRFKIVMLLDADTHVEPGYFGAALPLFDDPRVVAVAGCVQTSWRGRQLSFVGKLVAFHRQRIYSATQYLLKFGQTWLRANATHIVPGFASLYRTEVLPHIEVNPPGLVIEDFNMTFEVYQKRLGKVGFTPSAIATTQDPGTLRDYARQCKRWSLGLWQTVRRHPPRLNLFTLTVALLLLELLASSMMLVMLPFAVLVLGVPALAEPVLAVPWVGDLHGAVAAYVNLNSVLFGVVLPDLLLTVLIAAFRRQPWFLVFGWFFLLFRVLDSAIALYALGLAWVSNSSGRWRSPGRRVFETSPATVSQPASPDARAG